MSKGTGQAIGYGITSGILAGVGVLKQKQEDNEIKSILEDPKSTPMQKALALSKKNPQLAAQYFKQEGRSNNLRALEESVRNQLNPQPQGAGGPQMATRNATNPYQFVNDAGMGAPEIGMNQNQPQVANAPTPQQNPIQELARQEQAYKNAALEATNLGEAETARRYESLAKSAQKERLDMQNSNRQDQQFQHKVETEREKKVLPIQESAMQTIEKTSNQLNALKSQMLAVRQGSVSPFSKANLANLFRATGHEILAAAAETQGSAIFKTAGKEVIAGGLKDAFGGRPAIVEFEAYNAMLPEVGRNKKANELAIFSLQVPLIIKNETAKYKLDLIKNNPTISPIQLNNEAYQYSEQIKDQVYSEWKNILNDALKISQEESSQNWWKKTFGQSKSAPENTSTKAQGGKPPIEDIWK